MGILRPCLPAIGLGISNSMKKSPKKSGSVIITREEHGISRKLMSPNALRVLYRLKDNGFVACLVGGCVRDLLLGREPKDFDVVTNATPNEVKRLFRSCRLVGRRFRLAHIHFKEELIEVATFRTQASDEPEPEAVETRKMENRQRHPRMLKDDDGMILRDNVYGTPGEDALRRDFTVNALAYDIADFSIIDYVGGLADLGAGIIRTIGDPEVRFQEDPVRMLRAVRFAAQLGFTMEEETRKAPVAGRRHSSPAGIWATSSNTAGSPAAIRRKLPGSSNGGWPRQNSWSTSRCRRCPNAPKRPGRRSGRRDAGGESRRVSLR